MKNRSTTINLLTFPQNTISKIFTLIEDRDLLRLRERDDHKIQIISLSTYFEDFTTRNSGLLRITLTHIRSKFPLFNIKAHEDIGHIIFTMKLEDFHAFLEQFALHIAYVQWREIEIYDAPPEIIRSLSHFFNGKHVKSIHTGKMIMENADYSPWLTLIKNTTAEEFSFALSVTTKDDVNFLIELSENVDSVSICFVGEFRSSISLVSIAMSMLTGKCCLLEFFLDTSIFTQSDMETLLAFFHQIEKKVCFRANTEGTIQFLQVGHYYVNVYEFTLHSPDGRRVIIASIDA